MRSLSVTNLPKLLSTFPLNKLAVSLSNPANGPSYSLFMNNLLTRHAQVKRMAISGISDYQIAVLLRVKLNTLKLFFPRELELGAVIASIRLRSKAHPKPQSKKRTYASGPIPPGTIIVRGPNGQFKTN